MPRAILFLFIACFVTLPVFTQTGGAARPRASATPTLKNDTPSNKSNRPPAIKGGNSQKPAISTKPATEEEGVVTIETNLITTPVSVLDRNGRFIPNLKKKDFKIFEDGIPQTIELFQSSEMPFTVVLMIDISPSTRYKLDDIHYAALTFVNQLRPADRVAVVAFDQRVRLLCEPTTDKQVMYSAIYKAQFGSGTSLYDAVDAVATSDIIAASGRKAIVIFTDGVDTTSRRTSYESSVAGIEEIDALIYPIRYNTMDPANAPGKPLDPALLAQLSQQEREVLIRLRSMGNRGGYGRGSSYQEYERGKNYLTALSETSGGRVFDADTLTNLEASFSGVAEELRRQYSVGYYSSNEGQPGDRRQIKITVARPPRAIVRAKKTYIVKEKETEKAAEPTVSSGINE